MNKKRIYYVKIRTQKLCMHSKFRNNELLSPNIALGI